MLAHDDARAPSWATRADGARDGAHARAHRRVPHLASTELTRYARYDALITPPSPTLRGVLDEGALAPQVQYRTATLAHDDARAPSWATRADGARDGAHPREIERRRVHRIASTGLARYARYDALITPPSPTQRGVDASFFACLLTSLLGFSKLRNRQVWNLSPQDARGRQAQTQAVAIRRACRRVPCDLHA